MGIHEWLIKRGERYEVTPELHGGFRSISLLVILLPGVILMLLVFLFLWLFRLLLQLDRLVSWLAHPQVSSQSSQSPTSDDTKNGTSGITNMLSTRRLRSLLISVVRRRTRLKVHLTASDPERRIKFQADVQDYVDQSISSTINLPAWNSQLNNPTRLTTSLIFWLNTHIG